MARGFGIPATDDANRARTVATGCEQLGYSSIWTNDTPAADGILTAARLLEASDRLRVGVGVVACDRRPPQQIIELVRSMRLPLNRLVLGVGAGSSPRPLWTVRQAVGLLRRELGAELTIAVAAMGPQMCALAGELADVVLLNWMLPERVVWAGSRVAQGAARRTLEAPIECAAYIRVALDPDGTALIRSEAARYDRIPPYHRHFQQMGAPLDRVGVAGASGQIGAALAAYDSVLDTAIVRALPGSDAVDSTLAVARAAAPGWVH